MKRQSVGARRVRFRNLPFALPGAVLLMLAAHAEAQTQIFPQITDGGGWRVAIVLENTTTSATTASLSFFQDAANGATTPWNPPFVETSSTQGMQIPAGGTLYLHTPGTAATLSQGWGQLTGTGVVGYAIYTLESYSGRPDQDGTSQAETATTRVLVPFDNTPGFATGMAIVNPTSTAETILVNIQTDAGAVTQTSLPLLPASGQIAIVTAQQIPATNGSRGMAEFYVPAGNLSVAAFRFNPTLALTSLPVFPQDGPPVLGGGSSGGGGLQLISITATPVPDPLQIQQDLQIQVYGKLPDGTYSVGTVDGFGGAGTTTSPTLSYTALFTSITTNGQTFNFGGLSVASSMMGLLGSGTTANITSGSVTVNLSPGGAATSGTASGTLNLVSTAGTVTQTFTGTYAGN